MPSEDHSEGGPGDVPGDVPAGSQLPAWAAYVDVYPRQVYTEWPIQPGSEQTLPSSSECGPRPTTRTPSITEGGKSLNSPNANFLIYEKVWVSHSVTSNSLRPHGL